MRPEVLPDRLLPIRPGSDAAPLYCVPPASGSPYGYLPLAAAFDPGQAVYALDAPGFDDDEPVCEHVADLSSAYLDAIAQHQGDAPACLLGWSLGGVVAYDMACRRAAAGLPVPVLIVVDAPVPVSGPKPLPQERLVLRRFVADLMADPDPDGVDAVIDSVPVSEPISAVFDALADKGVIPAELHEVTLARRYGVFRGGTRAMAEYRADAGYPGRVLAIRAQDTPKAAGRWRDLAPNAEEHVVPGGHYSIWQGGGLVTLSGLIRRALSEVSALDGDGAGR